MRLSVTARLALLAITLTLISNLALVAFVWQRIHDDAIESMRRDTIEQSDAFVAIYRSGGMAALRNAIGTSGDQEDPSLIAETIDRSGRRVAGVGPERPVIGRAVPTAFRIGLVGQVPPWSKRESGVAIRQVGPDWLVSGRLLDDWEQEQRAIERALLLAGCCRWCWG